jgi:hypothetical protein
MLNPNEKERAIKALSTIVNAIVDTVNTVPGGAPNGVVYAAVMHILSLKQYEEIIAGLVTYGKIKKQGDLLLPA